MTFANPWLLLIIFVIPLIALLKGKAGQKAAFLYSSVSILKGITNVSRSRSGAFINFLRWLAILMFILGLARPRVPEGQTKFTASGVDIMIALDLSNSMLAEDFYLDEKRVNRLEIAKDVLRRFIQKRPNDRLGMVVFARHAYLAVPMTLNHEFLLKNLERLNIGVIENDTAIGDGLATSINRLKDLEAKSRIVILITDGDETVNEIPPLTSAEIAESYEVKVYTIGVGTRGKAPFPQMSPFGGTSYVPMDVSINEDLLKKIAERTSGKYYRADNTEKFIEIYNEIDSLEKSESEVKLYSRYQELFYYFVACGLVFLSLEIILTQTIFRTIP